MVSREIVPKITWTLLVGVYLPPSTLEHLSELEEVVQRFRDPIFFGGLNKDLDEARILRIQCFLDLLSEYGLIDLVEYF